jgi:hypothetical protein
MRTIDASLTAIEVRDLWTPQWSADLVAYGMKHAMALGVDA